MAGSLLTKQSLGQGISHQLKLDSHALKCEKKLNSLGKTMMQDGVDDGFMAAHRAKLEAEAMYTEIL